MRPSASRQAMTDPARIAWMSARSNAAVQASGLASARAVSMAMASSTLTGRASTDGPDGGPDPARSVGLAGLVSAGVVSAGVVVADRSAAKAGTIAGVLAGP